jgi:hypothetical protein
MSHIVQIKSEVKDENAVRAACQRLGWAEPTFGDHRVFSVNRIGLGVTAPGWQYPIVCDLNTGAVDYDNYNGSWGNPARLDEFMQAYAIEKAKIQAGLSGYTSYEEILQDGSVKLTVVVEG